MCDLKRKSKKQKQVGWKEVAEDEKGDYYSPAMGCKYPKNGKVPVVKVQQQIVQSFNPDILIFSYTFNSKMTGRTAIYLRKRDAIARIGPHQRQCLSGFTIKIKKAIVSDDIMFGSYGSDKIAAGKHIEFLE